MGNAEAENIVTIVSNPYCQPCSKAHKILDEWIAGLENIKVQVVFSANENDNDKKTIVARHLMALNTNDNREIIKNAVQDWYEGKKKDYSKWAEVYPLKNTNTVNESIPIIARQLEWCKASGIKGTPTIFINGRKLPGPWQLEDIKYFMN